MRMDDYTALFEKFTMLSKTLLARDKAPTDKKKKKAVSRAWLDLVLEFIRIEMPDRLEMINFQSCMLHPLAERKMKIFEG